MWVQHLSALAQVQADHLHTALVDRAKPRAAGFAKVLTPHQHETVAALAELIIPQTDTPGAKAALVDRFIDASSRTATRPDRRTLSEGLAWLDARSQALFRSGLRSPRPRPSRPTCSRRLSADGSAEIPRVGRFFAAIKSMTITGYYTSEIGLRDELGDNGQLFLPAFEGCTHPEHQR